MNTYEEILNAFDDVTRDSSRFYFSQAQVDRFANRALREICERTRMLDAYEDINSVAGTLEYSVTGHGYDVFRVEYDDLALAPIGRDSLRTASRDWATRTGLPRYYYVDEIYSEQEYLTVGLFEAPQNTLTDAIKVWYHPYPTTAIGTTAPGLAAELDIPDWGVGAVLFYMLYLAFVADTQMQSFESAAIYKMMYEDLLDRLVMRSRDRVAKEWVSGAPARGRKTGAVSRLPDRITTAPAKAATPTLLTTGGGSIVILWSHNTDGDMDYYKVYRRVAGGGFTQIDSVNHVWGDVGHTDAEYEDTTPVVGTTYYYAVSAVDVGGLEGEKSDELLAVTLT